MESNVCFKVIAPEVVRRGNSKRQGTEQKGARPVGKH